MRHARGQCDERATARRRHVPERTCIGCRRTGPAPAMVRCTLDEMGNPHIGAGQGRGAWVCSLRCVDDAVRRGAFSRAWRRRAEEASLTELRELVARTMQVSADPGTLSGELMTVGLTDQRRMTTRND